MVCALFFDHSGCFVEINNKKMEKYNLTISNHFKKNK